MTNDLFGSGRSRWTADDHPSLYVDRVLPGDVLCLMEKQLVCFEWMVARLFNLPKCMSLPGGLIFLGLVVVHFGSNNNYTTEGLRSYDQ